MKAQVYYEPILDYKGQKIFHRISNPRTAIQMPEDPSVWFKN